VTTLALLQLIAENAAVSFDAVLDHDGVIKPDMQIELKNSVGSVRCPAAIDPALKRGIVSLSHGWPGNRLNPFEATNALVDDEREIETINAMPVMTGIRVSISQSDPTKTLAKPTP